MPTLASFSATASAGRRGSRCHRESAERGAGLGQRFARHLARPSTVPVEIDGLRVLTDPVW